MSTIATLSKLCSRCEKCKYKDSCNNKRMVACRLAEMPPSIMKSATTQHAAQLTQPIMNQHSPITIKMGEYGTVNTSLEEIKEKIKKEVYSGIFNKS